MLTPSLLIAISLARADWTDGAPLSASPAQLLEAGRASVPAKDYTVDVLVDQERYTVDDQGRVTVETWVVYKILDPSAVDGWGTVAATWAPWHQDRAEVRARVIDPDGREWTLDPKTLVEATGTGNTSYSFDDNHTLRGPLPGVRVGSVVEEVQVVREHRAFVGQYGSGSTRIDRGGLDDALRVVRVEAPAGVPLRWEFAGLDDPKIKVQERHTRGATVIEVTAKEYPKLEDWQTKLSLNQLQGRYLQFSTAPSWNAVVSAYADQIEPLIDPAGLDDILAAARAGKNEDERIQLAVRAVQARLRYAAIPFGEHAIVPYTPALALSRAYGDCKDQAVTVTAALRALGFDAHVALLWSGAALDLPGTVPRLDRFNHAIVVVKRATGDLWIDPTVRGTPVGELPYGDEHHLAVVVDKATTAPVITPRGSATFRQTIDVDLSRAGPAPIHAEMTGTGWAIGGYRESLADVDQAGREAWAEGAFGVEEEDKHEVRSTFRAVEQDDKNFAFTVDYLRPNSAYVGITDSIARVGPTGLLADVPIPDDEMLDALKAAGGSATTLRLSPERSEVIWRMQLPPGMSWDAAPVDDSLVVGPVHLSRTLTHDDKNLWTLAYRLDVTDDAMTLPQAAEFAEALKLGTYNTTLSLTAHAEFARQISDGHTFDAAKMAREVALANPDSPLARAQLVVALEDAGLGDAALAEATVLSTRWPNTVESMRAELSASSRDPRGRYVEGGWDRARSRAALEALGALEPKATALSTLRIRMLLAPPDTQDPPPAADVALASTLLDALIKETGETTDTKSLRIQIRYLSGELSALAALPYDGAWNGTAAGDWMAAVLLKRGASAIGLTRQAIDSSVRAAATKRAMQDLARARRPDLSLALLCFDLPGEFAKIFASRKDVKPWETVVEENGPLAPFVASFALTAGARGAKPAWSKFQSPVRDEDEGDLVRSRHIDDEDPMMVNTVTDSIAMMYEPPVIDHELARAEIRDPSSGEPASTYATVDGPRVRVIGTWSTAGAVARAALARLDRQDVDGAARLLAWIEADLHGDGSTGEESLAQAFHTVWPAPADMEEQAAMRRALTVAALFAPGGWTTLLDAAKAKPAEWPASTLGLITLTECTVERWSAAVAIARHAMSVGNTDRATTLCLMRGLREVKDHEAAIAAGRAWLATHPDDHGVLSAVASSLYAAGRDAEALEAARVAGVDRVSANSAAWLMLLAGEDQAGLKAITPLGTESNASSAVRHTYAVALIACGRLVEAQKEWERARQGSDMGDEWWYVAGGLAEGLGLREQAITAYRRVERSEDRDATWQFAARALTRLGEKP